MKLEILKATVEDASQLIKVQNESFYEDYIKYEDCPSYQESIENMLDMISHAIVYKIIVDQELVGDVIIRKRGNHNYYLRTIAITPKYQNKGIGKIAVKHVESDNPDGTIWTLITPEGAKKNKKFYESLGYVAIGSEKRSNKLTLIRYMKEKRLDTNRNGGEWRLATQQGLQHKPSRSAKNEQ
jgi:ribosomal protein S18 acetylase RimI-like enzyme